LIICFAAALACQTGKTALTADQEKHLSHSLPPNVREILEKSQKFSLLAEEGASASETGHNFDPPHIARINDEAMKREVLENLYFDVAVKPVLAACYDPHHGIRAEYNGQKVEIDICFTCVRIVVRSPFGEFSGAMRFDDNRSKALFEKILQDKGVKIETETL
jgi:hypothetical protein